MLQNGFQAILENNIVVSKGWFWQNHSLQGPEKGVNNTQKGERQGKGGFWISQDAQEKKKPVHHFYPVARGAPSSASLLPLCDHSLILPPVFA